MKDVRSIRTRVLFAVFLEGAEGDGYACLNSSSGGGWRSDGYRAGLIQYGYGESGKAIC